jgi:hypothetical protein
VATETEFVELRQHLWQQSKVPDAMRDAGGSFIKM